jgi:hypothetical protein
MGSFVSQPPKVVCRDLDEIRTFLSTCRYVSDREQFGVRDHWMQPEEFEQSGVAIVTILLCGLGSSSWVSATMHVLLQVSREDTVRDTPGLASAFLTGSILLNLYWHDTGSSLASKLLGINQSSLWK